MEKFDYHHDFAKRLRCIFYSPGETFIALKEETRWHDWLIPSLIVIAVSIISIDITMPIFVRDNLPVMIQRIEQIQNLTQSDKIYVFEIAIVLSQYFRYILAPVQLYFLLFILSFIIQKMCNLFLNSYPSYRQILCLCSYISLIGIPSIILYTFLVLGKETLYIDLGLNVLLPRDLEYSYLAKALSQIQIFNIWQISLIALGVSILTDKPPGKTTLLLFSSWLIWILFRSLF